MPKAKFNATELLVVFTGSAAFGAFYALYAGQDINWDWQNYHEYSVWAWLHQRDEQDVAPPGISGFFNPFPYMPAYFLRHFLPVPYGAMVLSAMQGFAFGCIWMLARTLIGSTAPSRFSTVFVFAAFLMALSSPVALSEIGTSFADGLTAIPTLIGLCFLFGAQPFRPFRYFLGGALLGMAVGCKNTNAIFAVGAFAAVGLASKPLRSALSVLAGIGVGALATGGFWALHLYRTYGSPLYPFYNAIFKSREALPTNFSDTRFLPRGIIHGLAYPLLWSLGKHPSAEVPFRDSRFAVFFLGCAVLIAASMWRRRGLPLYRADYQFIAFILVCYLLWMLAFSIQRYAITLELAISVAIVLFMARCLPPTVAASFALVLAIAMAIWSRPADWGRRPWSDPVRQPEIPRNLQVAATYFIIDKPVALVALYLPQNSRFYQLEDANFMLLPGQRFDRIIQSGLHTPLPGGVWAIRLKRQTPTPFPVSLFEGYGQLIDASRPCEIIDVPSRLEVCPLMTSPKAAREGLGVTTNGKN